MRHKGWVNPFWDSDSQEASDDVAYSAFEAGADAILDALKKEARYCMQRDEDGKYIDLGYLVFIPEEG